VTVADFTIDRPGLLEINRKIATMGGGDSHRVKKKASLCSASVCFFGGFGRFEIEGLPPQKKNIGGKAWAGPPNNMLHLLDGVADGDMVALLFCGWCEDEHVEVK
jgi:hypothetical protein